MISLILVFLSGIVKAFSDKIIVGHWINNWCDSNAWLNKWELYGGKPIPLNNSL